MNYDWYFVFNHVAFAAEELVSRTVRLNLEGIGEKEILITVGNYIGLTYEGVLLCANMEDRNPFSMDGYAIYVKDDGDVYLGIEVADAG